MKVHIPNSAFLGNIDGTFLRGGTFDTTNNSKLEITADKRWFSVHPIVVAIIGALGKSVDPRNIACEQIIATSGHYLTVMELFNFIGIKDPVEKEIEKHELTGRVIPLTQIKDQKETQKFLQELVPPLHLKPGHTEAVQYIFSELIRNVLEHASSPIGAIVCAQYFKKSNKISIGIADSGMGLRKSLQESHRVANDTKAINLALQPGITGTTAKIGGTTDNAGMGLFFIKTIAALNGNFFNVISGGTMYKLKKRGKKPMKMNIDPFDDRHSLKEDVPHWQGVAIGIDISLDQTKELHELLGTINKFYKQSLKDLKKRKFKKPKFL